MLIKAAIVIAGAVATGYAEIVTIRRVAIRNVEMSGLGAVAALRFRIRAAEHDRCSLRDASCRDHRLHPISLLSTTSVVLALRDEASRRKQ